MPVVDNVAEADDESEDVTDSEPVVDALVVAEEDGVLSLH